jgi:hypothetical protein
MIDVEVRNFQSIEHIHVQIEGFTALVGRSNLGKSALVRAIKAALTGAAEGDSVRHGPTCEREVKGTKNCKCFCSVHIKTEGFDLLWEKGGDKNEYVFNGTKYTAVGKGTPEFLEAGFGLVKIGDTKVLLQVADQFRHEGGGPIFLLDEAGSIVADVLSDVAQLDRINVASRMAEKDRKESVAQRKLRERDVMDLKIKTASYDGLDDVLARVREVEADEEKVNEQRRRRDQVAGFLDAVVVIGRQYKLLSAAVKVEIPEITPVVDQQEKFEALSGYISGTQVRAAIIDKLRGVEVIVPPIIDPLHENRRKFEQLSGWLTRIRSYKDLFTRLTTAEAVPCPDISDLLTESVGAIRVATLYGRYTLAEQAVGRLEEAYATVETEYTTVQTEKAELGVCPTCTQPVDLDHDHEHAAE